MGRILLRNLVGRAFLPLTVALTLLAGGRFDATRAADVNTATSTSATTAGTVSQSLRHFFNGSVDGKATVALSDLRAMQGHVRSLSDHLRKCTVGVQVGPAWGSGVIISKDGYVLTAAHVAGQPNADCEFKLSDGRALKGKTMGLYKTLDAGLMKITDAGEYAFAELGNSDDEHLRAGQWCISMGHPNGFNEDRGAVLRLGQILLLSKDAITTNCTLVGGDSGGPLFDMDGRVIGINSRIGEQNYNNMHVPVNAFHERDAWNRMIKGDVWGHLPGQVPWLGVGADENSKEAKVGTVTTGSPAEKNGLKPGDVVVSFDGREISNFSALKQAVDDCYPNEFIRLKIRRGQEIVDIGMRLGRKAE